MLLSRGKLRLSDQSTRERHDRIPGVFGRKPDAVTWGTRKHKLPSHGESYRADSDGALKTNRLSLGGLMSAPARIKPSTNCSVQAASTQIGHPKIRDTIFRTLPALEVRLASIKSTLITRWRNGVTNLFSLYT